MDQSELHILIIEDDQEDYLLTREVLLEAKNWSLQLDWARTYDEGITQLQEASHDVYLVDYNLGEHTGLDILKAARSIPLHQPFILLTGRGDYDTDLKASLTGASDYLEKGRITPNILERSIRYALQRSTSEAQLRSYLDELKLTKKKLGKITAAARVEIDDVLTTMNARVASMLPAQDQSSDAFRPTLLKQQKHLDELERLLDELGR